MRQDPDLQLVKTYTSARTYFFRSSRQLGGYAYCTVNDETGALSIISDWGNWSHMWNPAHLGCASLTHFIADRRGYDYLANKLLGRDEAWVLDADATISKWRRRLLEARRAERIGAHEAREIWHRLGSLFDDEGNESIFIEHAYRIEGFDHWISERPWEETEHRYSHVYRALVDWILPALARACAETAKTMEAA